MLKNNCGKEGREKEGHSLFEKHIKFNLRLGERQAWNNEKEGDTYLAIKMPHIQDGQWEVIQR